VHVLEGGGSSHHASLFLTQVSVLIVFDGLPPDVTTLLACAACFSVIDF
jgi:hypothetical protein